jgi:hypothetical protein
MGSSGHQADLDQGGEIDLDWSRLLFLLLIRFKYPCLNAFFCARTTSFYGALALS